MIVHILLEGFAICGTMEGFPGEWPAGHRWTYEWDLANVTCSKCLEVLNKSTGQADCAKKERKNRPGCG